MESKDRPLCGIVGDNQTVNHILWINQHAAPIGGCERYILQTNLLLRHRGLRSTLLYEVSGEHDPAWVKNFEGAFPIVQLDRQIEEIQPDAVYIHRLTDDCYLNHLLKTGIAAVRLFHDHQLFCLREHKYTTIGNRTCVKPTGFRCYPCLGFLNKSSSWPGFRLKCLGNLIRKQKINRQLQAFVVGSTYMKNHVAAHGFDEAKIHVLPLFTDPPTAVTEKRENDLLLFVGQLNRGKGLDLVLQALPQVSLPIRLVVVGSGNQETEYRALCNQLDLAERVTFAGKAPGDELGRYYQRAACVVFPSRAPETFGLVGLEAMNYGCPVIAADVGGVREWLVDGVTGLLFPSNDIKALSDRMERIFTEPAFAKSLGNRGYQRVQTVFQPENHVQELISLFESLKGIKS